MWAAFAPSGVVLGAANKLNLYQRTMFGKVENPKNERLPDLSHREFATFAPLLVLAVWMGLYPAPFLRRLDTSVQHIIARVSPQYAPTAAIGQHRAADPRSRTLAASNATVKVPGNRRATHGNPAALRIRRIRAGKALMPPGISTSDFYYILPELVLTAGALLVLVADVVPCRSEAPRTSHAALSWLTLAVIGATLVSLVPFVNTRVEVAHGLLAVDRFALFFKLVFLAAAAMTVLMSIRYLEIEGAAPGEYYFLILCATLGMMVMAGGIDLITIFIGLETMAVAFYILAGFLKPNQRSNEAAVKYFLLGAFSLGILLYGMSIMYGLSGTTGLTRHGAGAQRPGSAIRGSCSRSFWSSRALGSKLRPCRSTCGRPTSTRARRRRLRRSCPSDRQRPRLRCCCESSSKGCRR